MIGFSPQSTAMGFDDGLADGQAKAKAIRLGRREWFEQMRHLLRTETNALIDDMHCDATVHRFDQDAEALSLGRRIPIGVHGVL